MDKSCVKTSNVSQKTVTVFTTSRYPESRFTLAAEARAAAARMRASLVSMVMVRGATRYWPGPGPATVYIDHTNTRHAQTRETRGSKEQYCNYHNSGSVFSAD